MNGIEILLPVVLLLSAGFLVIYISRLFHISPIVGFLLVGIVMGPHGFQLIEETSTTHFLAELGVMFLLFDIGLHFSTKSAWSLRKDLFGLAPLQLFLSGLLLAFSMAFIFGLESNIALLAGLTLALSSTAVVIQVLADMKQTESPVGQSAKAVLIFQDLAAIFLLIFADSLGGDIALSMAVTQTLGKTILAFMAAIFLGKYVLTSLMKSLIQYDDPEMFTVLGLLLVMMTGLATASVGLSITLGAFLAGMVMAETPFRVLLQTELRPFRSLLLALFFITIGMLLNPLAIWAEIGTVLSLTALLIATKAAIIGALVFVFKRPAHQVLQLTFMLAQGSEFAFVIFTMATVQEAFGEQLAHHLIAAVALSMLFTPFFSILAYRWSLKVCDELKNKITNYPERKGDPGYKHPVLIVGMNEVGKTLARALKAHSISYIAVDSDRKRFLEATAAGYIVAFGRTSDLRFWNSLGVNRAKALCIASPDYEVTRRLSPIVRKLYPALKRYVAVNDSADAVRFASLGLTPFHNKGAPPGLEMAAFILKEFGIEDDNILSWSEEEQSAWLDSNKSTTSEEIQIV